MDQAPKAWFEKLGIVLYSLGFHHSESDHSLFIWHTQSSTMYLLTYLDDLIVTGSNNSEIQWLFTRLNTIFALKDLGPLNFFLGIEATFTSADLFLSQQKYIDDLLSRAKMFAAKLLLTTMISGFQLAPNNSDLFHDP